MDSTIQAMNICFALFSKSLQQVGPSWCCPVFMGLAHLAYVAAA